MLHNDRPRSFAEFLKRLWADESGTSSVEYAILIALILLVVLGAVTALGTRTADKHQAVSSALEGDDDD